jgi:hypothetical protein
MPAPRKLLITTAVSVALLSGCSSAPTVAEDGSWETSEDTRICRDKDGKRVDDVNCEFGARSNGIGAGAFMWLYLARGSRVPGLGRAAKGGSTMRAPGVSYSSASSIERGGFGRSAGGRSSSGFRGGGG